MITTRIFTAYESFSACSLLTGLFLSSLSIFKTKRTYNAPRDDPRVIRQRFMGVGLSCILSTIVLYVLFAYKGRKQTLSQLAWLMGLRIDHLLISTICPLILTASLFLGPLVVNGVEGRLPFQRNWTWRGHVQDFAKDLRTWRTYFVGPVVEEWVFRACMIPVMYAGGWSKSGIILITPLLFGAGKFIGCTEGHERPLLEPYKELLSYTTLFGWYTSFLFMRTGHLAGPTVSHVFCNIMGLPDFGAALRPSRYRNVYAASYLLGITGFTYLLFAFTTPSWYGGAYWT
ncbi:hypothetical protein SmJEL517_g05341 [Synchytrium microbalum]|uniref:intramembrane prenyl-peptidase Rce1 n=1 Tax=Synchytrium microbalum TaxID=1806994 RepID=A0A507BZU9_9FUNG|nr:uncharacterized protein SmJEL517_g05341 [Synchytrium microbalum]TPX31324.1 hypothetical protein SmJEL517_g05341 [Synchytrium microbalum]